MDEMWNDQIVQLGAEDLDSKPTNTEVHEGPHWTERYVGPSAPQIAAMLPHSVRLVRGWFWTSTAVCHGGGTDRLAFRTRPDGNGIEVRCHTAGCSPDTVIAGMEEVTGLPIRTAYEPTPDPDNMASRFRNWPPSRLAIYGGVALAFAVPLLLGHGLEVASLSVSGYSAGWFLAANSILRSIEAEERGFR